MNIQALDDPEGSETEFGSENGEETVEECRRPANLGEDEDDDLEDDKHAVEHGPKGTRRLIGHSTITVFTSASETI